MHSTSYKVEVYKISLHCTNKRLVFPPQTTFMAAELLSEYTQLTLYFIPWKWTGGEK